MPVPNTDCSLLVASAETGGRPIESRAGSAIMPPPPAMASTKPARSPTPARASRISGSSIWCWIGLGQVLEIKPGREAQMIEEGTELTGLFHRPIGGAGDDEAGLALQHDAILEHAQAIGRQGGTGGGDVDHEIGNARGGGSFGGAEAFHRAVFGNPGLGEMLAGDGDILGGD